MRRGTILGTVAVLASVPLVVGACLQTQAEIPIEPTYAPITAYRLAQDNVPELLPGNETDHRNIVVPSIPRRDVPMPHGANILLGASPASSDAIASSRPSSELKAPTEGDASTYFQPIIAPPVNVQVKAPDYQPPVINVQVEQPKGAYTWVPVASMIVAFVSAVASAVSAIINRKNQSYGFVKDLEALRRERRSKKKERGSRLFERNVARPVGQALDTLEKLMADLISADLISEEKDRSGALDRLSESALSAVTSSYRLCKEADRYLDDAGHSSNFEERLLKAIPGQRLDDISISVIEGMRRRNKVTDGNGVVEGEEILEEKTISDFIELVTEIKVKMRIALDKSGDEYAEKYSPSAATDEQEVWLIKEVESKLLWSWREYLKNWRKK